MAQRLIILMILTLLPIAGMAHHERHVHESQTLSYALIGALALLIGGAVYRIIAKSKKEV